MFSISFLAGRLLERRWTTGIVYLITKVGAFWLAASLYMFIFFLFTDLLNLFVKLLTPETGFPSASVLISEILIILLITGLLILSGYLNAIHPRIKTLKITVEKHQPKRKKINIVAVSDVHLGSIVGEKRVAKMVAMINSLDPDIVLFLGDLLDEDPGPVIHKDLGTCLERIKSKHGIYAITGNHEYIGGIQKAVPFFKKHGIQLLRDEKVLIEDQLYLIGREDRDKVRFEGTDRKSLSELIKEIDHSKIIILLDHQPFHLDQSRKFGIDLHLSGHTHHGQIWPFQYITKKIYKISHGYLKSGATHYYVSSGFGTWGPPIRLGNRPEVLYIQI
jgi:predicted MPP superfamily phosphohydrolase